MLVSVRKKLSDTGLELQKLIERAGVASRSLGFGRERLRVGLFLCYQGRIIVKLRAPDSQSRQVIATHRHLIQLRNNQRSSPL